MANHPIVHVEFVATDPRAAGTFYADLFGWQVQVDETFNYPMFQAEGGPGGGFVAPSNELGGLYAKAGDALVYVGTDDIDATLAKAEALGGSVVVPKTEIPGSGWFGVFTDPSGSRVALYTSLHQ